MNFNVLFIDDDAFMLKALLIIGKRLKPDWHFFGCEHSSEWLKVAKDIAPLDLIICDYQMPEMNGEQVLFQAKTACPTAVRVLLTGDISEEMLKKAVQFSHHIVGKPFSEQDILRVFESVIQFKRKPFDTAIFN
ncbi:response regulator [Alishewanella sp. SMS8]|uniref:response regulator n=1 Tax=Alishewanella sp. SMS8 TaxID=2994676 RepID=UPI0027404DD4|nr:response regulator [Alishewanella sp. SMS8]MDP5187942.1 response regulator [Alishewanella sp.]MDP5460387.1 response regulator [Alishewanella sp. SMS8]